MIGDFAQVPGLMPVRMWLPANARYTPLAASSPCKAIGEVRLDAGSFGSDADNEGGMRLPAPGASAAPRFAPCRNQERGPRKKSFASSAI
jgi:hypothetical protein